LKPRSAKRSSAARPSDTAELRARLHEAESRLRALEERHELAMGAIRESVYDWDIEHGGFSVSKSMNAMLGLPGQSLTLQAWQERIHPEDFARFRDETIAHLKGQTERFECDYRYRAGDGGWRWARTHGIALRNAEGRALRMVGSTGDITELKQRERELAEQRAILETTFENIDQGITMVDNNLRTIALNRKFLELLEFPPERFARGFHMDEAFRFNAERGEYGPGDVEEQVRQRVELSRRFEPHAFERTRPNGQVIAVRGKPLPDGGFVSTYTDITEQKRTERALRESEERYALATRAATEGIYEWNVESGALFLSDRAREVFGLPPGELRNTNWNERVHPDDMPAYRAALIEHFKGRTDQLECEYRVRDAFGSYRWVLERAKAVRNPDGRVVKLIGAESDITQRKLAEIELRRARDQAEEALEQQKAIAEVLGVVTQLQTDVQPVFEAIGRNAARLCGALFSCVYRFDGELIHLVATHNLPPAAMQVGRSLYPMRPDRSQLSGRAVLTRSVQRLEDAAQDADYAMHVAVAGGWRRLLAVPMLREAEPLGVIAVGWRDPGPIPEPRVELLKTFADQAVIAIEKVRLFNETKEALEQQKALAEVLGTISRSVADTKPVFDLILDSCQRLFEGHLVGLTLGGEDGLVRLGAYRGENKEEMERVYPYPLNRDSGSGQAMLERKVVHFPDVDAPGSQAPPRVLDGSRAAGFKSIVFAPLVAEGRALGALWVGRRLPGPFSEREIALLKSFADQAVIAIQNARLFNETKEALEQQTAISEVLQVISSSPTDVRPVLSAVAERAARLCEAEFVTVFMAEDGVLRAAGYSSAAASHPFPHGKDVLPFDRSYISGRAALTGQTVHLEDVLPLLDSEFPGARENQEKFGFRTFLAVPLLRNKKPIGVIAASRRVVRRFSDKQVALLETFADQAVIAIENVRLFRETAEALEQQKASGEVLQAISSSIADTAPVFDKILESCQRLFAGTIVGLNLVREDGMLHIGAYHGAHRGEFERIFPIPLAPESGSGLSILERRVVHYPDAEQDEVPERTRRGCKAIGIKSAIFAPVLWEGRGLGAIFVGRDHMSSFSEKEIALLRTFADQAAIAIENARLFREIQEKSRQLEIASRHKSEFLANMSHELRTPLNAIIGFTRIVMRQSKDVLAAKQYENLEKIPASGQNLLALINAVLDLSKVEAGRVEVQPREVELAPVLEQCLRTIEPLAQVALVKEFGGALPQMYVDEEKLRQIVTNLLSNAAKFTERGTIRLRAQAANGSVAITVADTGIGIAADKLGLIFEEFEQAAAGSTRVYGGTGLGLTIARRLARLMGGDIGVESSLGTGSRFTLTLPLRYSP
jgi:PAS domain S-box-containing protein